ncbi:MAG: acyl-CoA dehydrogenase family protein, partial [Gammaproteobacteria bacterium]
GYMNDSPAGRLLRDAKVYDIGGGTNEIRRWLIGRELVERGL